MNNILMRTIVSVRSLAAERRLERTVGLQPLKRMLPILEQIPPNYRSDFYICPMAFHGCEGAKDPQFYGRCAGNDYPYMNCDLWDGELTPATDLNEDTQEGITPLKKNHLEEESIHDALAEGVDPKKVAGFPFVLDRKNTGSVSEYNL